MRTLNGQEAGYLPVELKFGILPPTHSRLWLLFPSYGPSNENVFSTFHIFFPSFSTFHRQRSKATTKDLLLDTQRFLSYVRKTTLKIFYNQFP
ncbi:hypothetical protein OUZ56_009671 [Daphnia magna]|uniref:Uncharacterized protein n=1 Tax=Daphnia magna TaxID=35525 RepID=A0ABR0AGN5_9CRUS|nr:hypothetical protein OUZ56_009671 [Daphnia magna]